MIVGFTGTRRGMTCAQMERLRAGLEKLGPHTFVHGDCVGADAQAHDIADTHDDGLGLQVDIRPCTLTSQRAHCVQFSGKTYEPKPPLERNRDIVDNCDVMVACPGEEREQLRSGTWATIRYAKRKRKPMYIVYPSGRVEQWPKEKSKPRKLITDLAQSK